MLDVALRTGPLAGRVRSAARHVASVTQAHPLLAVLAVAVFARTAVAVAVDVLTAGGVLFDDASYSRMAAEAADGSAARWDPYTRWLYGRTGTLLWPMTAMYWAIGPRGLAGQLLVAMWGAGAAVAAGAVAMRIHGARAALVAGMCVALLPSQVFFSSLVLKDAVVWCLLAAIAVAIAAAAGAVGPRFALLWGSIAVLLVGVGFVRLHTMVVACWACALSAWFGPPRARLLRGMTALTAAIVVPMLLGVGPGGLPLVRGGFDSLPAYRVASARGGSAIQEVAAPSADEPEPVPRAETPAGAPTDAEDGVAATPGPPVPTSPVPTASAQPAPDPAFGTSAGARSNVSYLPTGLRVILVSPLPWNCAGSGFLRLACFETAILWYPLLALALLGLPQALRRLDAAAFVLVAALGVVLMWALTEGNLGTAYRHRGEFTWAVCVLAALGVARLLRWPTAVSTSTR